MKTVEEKAELIVFEGPDGVGKTSLSRVVAARLAEAGRKCLLMSFPGSEAGSVGRLVYDIHHSSGQHVVDHISPSSLQALHVAAHIDCVERVILPALGKEVAVVLDRFWWSTVVYGGLFGVKRETVDALISLEESAWEGVVPSVVFLVDRPCSLKPVEDRLGWEELRKRYRDLACREGLRYPVVTIPNGTTQEDATQMIMEELARRELFVDGKA